MKQLAIAKNEKDRTVHTNSKLPVRRGIRPVLQRFRPPDSKSANE